MKTIMLIDDSEKDRKLFEEIVKSIDESNKCIVAEEAHSAMTYLTTPLGPLPDFIFMEMNLQNGASGIECLHAIKKHRTLAHIPLIMFSNAHVQTYADMAKQFGASQCFTKAKTFDQNREMIASVIFMQEERTV